MTTIEEKVLEKLPQSYHQDSEKRNIILFIIIEVLKYLELADIEYNDFDPLEYNVEKLVHCDRVLNKTKKGLFSLHHQLKFEEEIKGLREKIVELEEDIENKKNEINILKKEKEKNSIYEINIELLFKKYHAENIILKEKNKKITEDLIKLKQQYETLKNNLTKVRRKKKLK